MVEIDISGIVSSEFLEEELVHENALAKIIMQIRREDVEVS